MPLHLPHLLVKALWEHARRDWPRECVGALGGVWRGPDIHVQAAYPLPNIAAYPESEYLADPGHLLRAIRAMEREGLCLAALYHSHPHGPERPSSTDTRLAAYPVPYLIADLQSRRLHAYLLPGGEEVELILDG